MSSSILCPFRRKKADGSTSLPLQQSQNSVARREGKVQWERRSKKKGEWLEDRPRGGDQAVAADEGNVEGVKIGEGDSFDGFDWEGRRGGEVGDGESHGLEGGGESTHGLGEEEVVVFRDLDVVESEEGSSRLEDVESRKKLGSCKLCPVDGSCGDGLEVGEEIEEGCEGELVRVRGGFPQSTFVLLRDVELELVNVRTEGRVELEDFDEVDSGFEASKGDASVEDGGGIGLKERGEGRETWKVSDVSFEE